MTTDLSRFDGKSILLTGATGFIGSHLCRRLRGCGADLHVISRSSHTGCDDGRHWWEGDLADEATAERIVAAVRPDVIIHLASHVAGSRDRSLVLPMLRNNLLSTVHLLNAAAERGCRVILAGSMEEPDAAESKPRPCSPYAAAKWSAGGYARMFHDLYQTDVATLRLFMVYGPAQPDTKKLVPYVTLSLLRGESPNLSSGSRLVDWIYIDDAVDALLAAAVAKNVAGETLEVGSGRLATVREVAERLGRLINPAVPLHFGAIIDRPRERVRAANIEATTEKLAWRPQVSLEEGLERTAKWYGQSSPAAPRQVGRARGRGPIAQRHVVESRST